MKKRKEDKRFDRIKCYKCGRDNPKYRISGELSYNCEFCGAKINYTKKQFADNLLRSLRNGDNLK